MGGGPFHMMHTVQYMEHEVLAQRLGAGANPLVMILGFVLFYLRGWVILQ